MYCVALLLVANNVYSLGERPPIVCCRRGFVRCNVDALFADADDSSICDQQPQKVCNDYNPVERRIIWREITQQQTKRPFIISGRI